MIFNKKVFVKSMILNLKFFVLSDFESNFLQRVRFQMNFSNTGQILIWIIYSASDSECISFAVCQVFMCSLKQGTFR